MTDITRRKFFGIAGTAAGAAAIASMAGCSSGGSSSSSSAASSSASASSSSSSTASGSASELATVTPGKLTVATGDPTYPPYVMNDDPESGEGFEAALTYAVAEKLGFDAEDVVWVRTGFDEAITPGEKDWDMNIQQFSVTEERKAAVDFSTPYFTPTQAVVVDAAEGHDDYATATSTAELADAVLGAESGSTSYTWGMKAINENIQVFDSNAVAANALNAHQIDGIVLDTPTAVYMADPEMEELEAAELIGTIPDSEADPLAFLLPKGSELTKPVSDAIDELIAEGVLDDLTEEWMADYTTDVPELS